MVVFIYVILSRRAVTKVGKTSDGLT